jgi:oligopeptide transport system substrate-binding protein
VKTKYVRLRRGETPGAIRISRRDFLKMGGTGLAGAALLGTAGCGVFQQGGQQEGGGGGESKESITINLGDTVKDLNSTTTTDTISFDILLAINEGLYRLDENTEPQPAQAEGVEISSDKLTHTFTLRDGIKWSDGSPVTAQDFEYAWLKALDPKTAGQYAYILSTFIEGATEFNAGEGSREDVAIKALDDKTLEVVLVAPSPFWLGLTSFFTYLPQKQEFVEKQGDNYAQSKDALLYNGPYLLTEFKPTEGVTLTKNEGYWDKDEVDIEKIEGTIVKEMDTAVNLYESGELDIVTLESQFVDEYRDSPEFFTATFFATFYFTWNYADEIFHNENIRRAIQMGVDREAIAEEILNDGSVPATGYVPDGLAGPGNQTFREARGPTMPEYNREEAKRLFQQGREELGGENPTIELLSYDDSVSRDIATFMQSQLEDIGMKIDVKAQPFDRKLELEANGDFQLSYNGWIADYNDPMTFLDLWLSDSSFNTQKYENERYDQLITDAMEETDFARRMDLLLEAEKLLVEEDAALAALYFEGSAFLKKPFLKNTVNQPYGGGREFKLWEVEQ